MVLRLWSARTSMLGRHTRMQRCISVFDFGMINRVLIKYTIIWQNPVIFLKESWSGVKSIKTNAKWIWRRQFTLNGCELNVKPSTSVCVDGTSSPSFIACFMDFTKAFHAVCYDILWKKLKSTAPPPVLISLYKSGTSRLPRHPRRLPFLVKFTLLLILGKILEHVFLRCAPQIIRGLTDCQHGVTRGRSMVSALRVPST